MSIFRVGYIRDFRTDLIWFLLLPFVAILMALAAQRWLPYVALASCTLWFTVPHHFMTWSRTYGMSEDWNRHKAAFTFAPPIIVGLVLLGFWYAPLTTFLIGIIWDNQHSLMQQHGFARIYDFKGRAGAPSTARIDLYLAIVLYANLMLTSPLWTEFWIEHLYQWNFPVSVDTVHMVHTISWGIAAMYFCFYLGHVIWCASNGYSLNPMKYFFFISSYCLWYYTSWHTNSFLVLAIASKIMHSVQYMWIVYWYLERKQDRTGQTPWFMSKISLPRLLLFAAGYAVAYQLLLFKPMEQFAFGLFDVLNPDRVMDASTRVVYRYDLYATTVINSLGFIHYFFDSFIWKVSDVKTQEGL